MSFRREGPNAELLDEPREYLTHEGGKSGACQAVVERLVHDGTPF